MGLKTVWKELSMGVYFSLSLSLSLLSIYLSIYLSIWSFNMKFYNYTILVFFIQSFYNFIFHYFVNFEIFI